MEQQRNRGVVLRAQRVARDARVARSFPAPIPTDTVEIHHRSARGRADYSGCRTITARMGRASGGRSEQTLRRLLGATTFEPGSSRTFGCGVRRKEPDAQSFAPKVSRDPRHIETARDARQTTSFRTRQSQLGHSPEFEKVGWQTYSIRHPERSMRPRNLNPAAPRWR